MTERQLSNMSDMTKSISIDPSALLTTSTINALHFPDLATSGISDSGGGGGKGISLNLDGVGMCDSIMMESFYEPSGQEETNLVNTNATGLQNDTSMTNSLKSVSKKEPNAAQKKRRSRKAQYDAVVDGISFDKIETVNINDEQIEADDAWLFQIPGYGTKTNVDNIFSWVHKEFKENDINATKHRLLCKLDDMSNARTVRSVSCHSFAGNQRSDSVKRSATEQQVHPGITIDEMKHLVQSTDLLENALYLTEFLNLNPRKLQLSTISLDSIEKDHDDNRFDLFLYDSLNDESDEEQFFDCTNETNLLQTIANERRLIEQLTRRCSSLDSLENFDSKPRLTSPARSITPLFNRNNSDTRPTSPASSSPLRHTVAITSPTAYHIRSRENSRDREREPLDYTDLEVMAKIQLENLRQAEKQGPLSKRFGGSSSNLINTDSRDGSPSSVFGATRNTSPVGTTGYATPGRSYSPSPAAARRVPIRKNSFVVTESRYTHVLPSVSPRSSSPAIRSGGSNASLASNSSTTSLNLTNPPGTKPPVVPKSTVANRNGVKPNNHRRSNTQTISTNLGNSYDLPDATEIKPATPITTRTSIVPANSTTVNRPRPPVSRPLQTYRGSQTTYSNAPKAQPTTPTATTTQKLTRKTSNELNSTFTAKQFASTENSLLNDVSNKPLTTPVRSQMGVQRRTPNQSSVEQIPPSTSSIDMSTTQTFIPRSSSTLSQGRKSGIPTIGKQSQRPSIPTATRPTTSNTIPSSQSSDNMMVTRNIRSQPYAVTRPQIPDSISPTSSWNEGCY